MFYAIFQPHVVIYGGQFPQLEEEEELYIYRAHRRKKGDRIRIQRDMEEQLVHMSESTTFR